MAGRSLSLDETVLSAAPSRAGVGPGADVGVTEDMIRRLVHAFYGDARRDPLIGPVFEAAVDDWDAHLAKLCDFWSSVMLASARFGGRPMAAHAPLPIGPEHFDRWLALFRQTARRVCPPPAAAVFVARAEMIAQSLQLGLAASRQTPGAQP